MKNDKTRSGVYAPTYYHKFQCIADRCQHSCCVGWEICIDDTTYETYKTIDNIRDTIIEGEDGPCFALTENGRCPHLNDAGLCNIILSHGEEYLSDICTEHPRFYNDVGGGRTEAGLGIVCEEACRLILEHEMPFALSKTEDSDEERYDELSFDALPHRDHIISIIEAPEKPFDETLAILKNTFKIPEFYTTHEWIERFLSLEILDSDWKELLNSAKERDEHKKSDVTDLDGKYDARLLTYFVYRHVSTAENMKQLRARLGFAILSVDMIRYLFEQEANLLDEGSHHAPKLLIELARRYSAEIEYSEDNTDELIFEFERRL